MALMPAYLRIWRQSGGCDHTIGCGIRVERFEAVGITDARMQTIKDLVEGDSEFVESLANVEIFELAGESVRLDDAHWGEAYRKRLLLDDPMHARPA